VYITAMVLCMPIIGATWADAPQPRRTAIYRTPSRDEHVTVIFTAGPPQRRPLADLPALVAEPGNPANRLGIAGVTVGLDVPLLDEGIAGGAGLPSAACGRVEARLRACRLGRSQNSWGKNSSQAPCAPAPATLAYSRSKGSVPVQVAVDDSRTGAVVWGL
jgi:hypothetical protein